MRTMTLTLSRIYKYVAAVLVLLAVFTSCQRRPLEEEFAAGGYAEILLLTDWSLLGEVPTGMTAIFYPVGGGTETVLMSNNTVGNTLRLRKGKYKVLVFNQSIYEFGSLTFDGMDRFESACVHGVSLNETVSQETVADLAWFKSVVHSNPDSVSKVIRALQPFNSDRFVYEVTEEMCQRQYDKEMAQILDRWEGVNPSAYVDTIRSMPPPVAPNMNITIHVKGIDNIYNVRAYISGMARADLFGLHRNTADQAIQVLSNWKVSVSPEDKKVGTVRTSFRTFGTPSMHVTENDINLEYGSRAASVATREAAVEQVENRLFVEFALRDAKTIVIHQFDVTKDIIYHEDELTLKVELNIDTPLPDVPDVIGSGGAGFDADVEDWREEDHDISI